MSTDPIRSRITQPGQRFIDEPVHVNPTRSSLISAAVSVAFGGKPPESIQVGHERVELRWMVPDGNGGMRPKYPGRDKDHEKKEN